MALPRTHSIAVIGTIRATPQRMCIRTSLLYGDLPVVHVLQRHVEVLVLEQRDDVLQVVA